MHSRSSALPSSKKTHSEQHKQILKQLLREGSNKTCADCKTAAHPRWASWSLGCFVCIRCSGIHRSMGTHISKVKSVDLDAWTDEQVENMLRWGNDKCNVYWEAKLPPGYVPDPLKIENFIRTKYDMKKWAALSTVPDSSTLAASSAASSTSSLAASTAAPVGSKAPAPQTTATRSHNLLDDDFGSFTSSPTVGSRNSPETSTVAARTTRSAVASHHGSFSAQAPSPSAEPAPTSHLAPQSAQSTGGSLTASNGRPDLKKSILSLYASPSSSSSSIPQQRQQQPQPTQQYPGVGSSSVNSLSNSLSGLSFGSSASRAQPSPGAVQAQATQPRAPAQQSWSNEWSDNKASSPSWSNSNSNSSAFSGSNTKLDDDLFKNVWG